MSSVQSNPLWPALGIVTQQGRPAKLLFGYRRSMTGGVAPPHGPGSKRLGSTQRNLTFTRWPCPPFAVHKD